MARQKTTQTAQLTFGLLILDPDAYRIMEQRQTRKCLNCGNQFNSHGPGNRRCSPCKDLESWTSPGEFSVHASF